MMKIHELKTIQPYFDRVWESQKLFEVRKNDRDFQVGDKIILKEYNAKDKTYGFREIKGQITYVLSDYPAIESGYVVFGFKLNNCIS